MIRYDKTRDLRLRESKVTPPLFPFTKPPQHKHATIKIKGRSLSSERPHFFHAATFREFWLRCSMTHAVDRPPATPLVKNSDVSELTKHISGDQGLEAVKDITFGSVGKNFVHFMRSFAQLRLSLDRRHSWQNYRVSFRYRQGPLTVPTREPPPSLCRPDRLFSPVMV